MRSAVSDMRSLLIPLTLALIVCGCSKQPTEQEKSADALLLRAKAFLSRGEYRQARSLVGLASELDESLGRTAKVAEELRLLGSSSRSIGLLDSALVFYNRAIEVYRSLADRKAVLDVTLEIASIVRMTGEERRAYEIYVEALRLAKVFNDVDGVRDIEWAMLPACRALDEQGEEKQILTELLQGYAGRKDARGLSRVQYEIGLSRFAVADYDSASRAFQRAFALAESAKDSLMSLNALLQLAITEDAAAHPRESYQAYGDAIRRSEKVRGAQPVRLELFTRVGNAYLRGRRFGDAARFYRAALTSALNTGNKLAEAYIGLHLGHCDLETNRDAATKSYRSSLELFRSLGYAPGAVYAEVCLGLAAQRSGQYIEASKSLKSAIETSSMIAARHERGDLYADCERAFLGSHPFPAYDGMIELLLQAGKTDEAFLYAEQRNNAILRNDLEAFQPKPLDETLTDALNRYFDERARHIGVERLLEQVLLSGTAQKEQLASIKTVIDGNSRRMVDASDAVVRLNKAFEAVVMVSGVALSAVQKTLSPGVAYVEFVPTHRSLYMFVVTAAKSSVQLAAVTADSIVSQSYRFLTLLRRRELRSDTTQVRLMRIDQQLQDLTGQLYSAFIRPIEGELAGVTKVIAVFTGDLPTVPLHALRRGTVPGAPFVGEQHLVTYLPTASALFLDAPELTTVRDVIGFGHPGNTGWDVEYELRDIRAFYKDAKLFFNQQASLSTLQNEKADVLHLATEFQYDAQSPGNSFIILSDGKTVDGVRHLPPGELFSLARFPTVVVSDLASNRLTIVPAEMYVFLASGTGALITNAYTPSRKTKKIFGESFYTALLQGNATPAGYWKTQLEMMKNSESSGQYAWGAFFLWGR
jgi:tetratricopeptide (TPR) repeat protein/CHAT domain-containing protein